MTDRTFNPVYDWSSRQDVTLNTLSLWFRGHPESPGMFNNDGNNQYTVIGSGADIYGTYDEFHFAYQSQALSGEGSISAQIVSMENTHQWAKAGVMIRNTLEPNEVYAGVFAYPDGEILFQYRDGQGNATTQIIPEGQTPTLPYWVRIKYENYNFIASMSSDGQDWVDINQPQYISLYDDVYVGLAVTSHNPDAVTTAVFSDVEMIADSFVETLSWRSESMSGPSLSLRKSSRISGTSSVHAGRQALGSDTCASSEAETAKPSGGTRGSMPTSTSTEAPARPRSMWRGPSGRKGSSSKRRTCALAPREG